MVPLATAKPLAPTPLVPFWLPASHFITGLVFLSSAAVLLPVVAGQLAASSFLHAHVVAVVHLVTLGWLTLSIMGALCQLFSVALGTALYSTRIAAVSLTLFAPGVAVFVIGLLAGMPRLSMLGAAVFATGLLLFIYNAYRTLLRSTTRDLTWWTLAIAFAFLLATIAFGASLAVNLETAHLGAGRYMALAVHVHVAVAGWVGLVIMAVARRLLPMFLLSHGTHEWPLRLATFATMAGAATLTLFHRLMGAALFSIAAGLLLMGTAAFTIQIASYLKSRHRPQLDSGIRLILAGGVFVLIAAALGGWILLEPGSNHAATSAYGVALLGGLMLFVAGNYYKILPFLVWNHRFAPYAGKRELPRIADLYNARIATLAGGFASAGVAGLCVAALTGSEAVAVSAGGAVAIGCVTEAVQLVLLLRMKVT